MFGRLSMEGAVVVGMYDINRQDDIKNSSLILFSSLKDFFLKRMKSIPWTSQLQISETSILNQSA